MDIKTGVFLGLHKNRESPKYFVVLGFVRGHEYPPIDIDKAINSHIATNGYNAVWFQETVIPDLKITFGDVKD